MNGAECKRVLAEHARTLGCAAFGVTRAVPLRDGGRLRAWIDRGDHADMDYLARQAEQRADPRRWLPEARSVICVAVRYGPPPRQAPPPRAPTDARLAQLFVGADYHRVLHRLLEALADQGRRLAGAHSQWVAAVDTQPLLERSLAVQAGLGTIGRHTQLIVPGVGTEVALGELITDVALPPDAPVEASPCASCSKCLTACPTGALRAGRGLDARRCLSYHTTASRGDIPEAHRTALGDRVYGCDECQRVCPWNNPDRSRPVPIHPDLTGSTAVALDRLHRWLTLSGKALKRELAGTALHWLPRATLARTICVVLGNLAREESREVLTLVAQGDRDPRVREHARWALARLEARVS